MAGKVEIEWLEPEEWKNKRQLYPRRQIYGKIVPGAEVEVTYSKRRWKARIVGVQAGRMVGQPPSSEQPIKTQPVSLSLAEELRRDGEEVKKANERAELLDDSYDPSEDESADGSGGGNLVSPGESGGSEAEKSDAAVERDADESAGLSSRSGSGTHWRKRKGSKKEKVKKARLAGEE